MYVGFYEQQHVYVGFYEYQHVYKGFYEYQQKAYVGFYESFDQGDTNGSFQGDVYLSIIVVEVKQYICPMQCSGEAIDKHIADVR